MHPITSLTDFPNLYCTDYLFELANSTGYSVCVFTHGNEPQSLWQNPCVYNNVKEKPCFTISSVFTLLSMRSDHQTNLGNSRFFFFLVNIAELKYRTIISLIDRNRGNIEQSKHIMCLAKNRSCLYIGPQAAERWSDLLLAVPLGAII